jgi:hypothetical protein
MDDLEAPPGWLLPPGECPSMHKAYLDQPVITPGQPAAQSAGWTIVHNPRALWFPAALNALHLR